MNVTMRGIGTARLFLRRIGSGMLLLYASIIVLLLLYTMDVFDHLS